MLALRCLGEAKLQAKAGCISFILDSMFSFLDVPSLSSISHHVHDLFYVLEHMEHIYKSY